MTVSLEKQHIVVIAGPTAAGKTALAMELCRIFGGEIVSADSMQVYRYMDIGTAKPSREEQCQVRHHLIDIVDPDETYSAALYASHASRTIEEMGQKGTAVFVTGGTGLYINALLGGLVPGPPADRELRKFYRTLGKTRGTEYLYDILELKDPLAALRIHPRDSVRIIRALEVLEHTGRSIVQHQWQHGFSSSRYECLKIGITLERPDLFKRIQDRTETMMERGLIQETEHLLSRGYDNSCTAMQSFCYRHAIDMIKKTISREEGMRRLMRDTRNYAKRQLTWFKRDEGIVWHTPGDIAAITEKVFRFLGRFL